MRELTVLVKLTCPETLTDEQVIDGVQSTLEDEFYVPAGPVDNCNDPSTYTDVKVVGVENIGPRLKRIENLLDSLVEKASGLKIP